MTCPVCGEGMWVNGKYWQCPKGHLVPHNGVVPAGVHARLVVARAEYGA